MPLKSRRKRPSYKPQIDTAKAAKDREAHKAARRSFPIIWPRWRKQRPAKPVACSKERFDYPIFLYEAEKVGITATGEPDANELYPNDNMPAGMKPEDTCLEVYRRFFANPAAFFEENRRG